MVGVAVLVGVLLGVLVTVGVFVGVGVCVGVPVGVSETPGVSGQQYCVVLQVLPGTKSDWNVK